MCFDMLTGTTDNPLSLLPGRRAMTPLVEGNQLHKVLKNAGFCITIRIWRNGVSFGLVKTYMQNVSLYQKKSNIHIIRGQQNSTQRDLVKNNTFQFTLLESSPFVQPKVNPASFATSSCFHCLIKALLLCSTSRKQVCTFSC